MAPFKSESQRRRFAQMVKEGKMSQETFDEWNSDTPKHIPEKVEKTNTITISKLKDLAKVKKI